MAHLAVLTGPKRAVAGVTAAAALLAVGALSWLAPAPNPERVNPSTAPTAYQAPRIAADAPVAAAPATTDYAAVVDVTDELLPVFSGDLAYARTIAQGQDAFPYGEPDQCLLDWASANLASLSAGGAYEVMTVCDRPTLILAGPDGADAKVLVHGALRDTAPAGARQLIGESTNDRMAFAAVRSADGKAQLLATAELSG